MTLLGSADGGLGSIDSASQPDISGGGGGFPGFGGAPPIVQAASSAGSAATAARSDHTHGSTTAGADWGIATTRFFACDGGAGSDANAGFSDVSQAAAGAVAVRTLARLLQIIPKFGAGHTARAAIKAGNYASDTLLDLSGFIGYKQLIITGTDTVATAGATAFAGDAADSLCAGFTNATGLNLAGYNATAYSVDAEGTPTVTLQLAGGGAAGFGAMPARPYGCRLRGVITTATGALQNFCTSIIAVTGGNVCTLGLPLAAVPVFGNAGDVFVIEMPNVTGPTTTQAQFTGNATNGIVSLVGLSLGQARLDFADLLLVGCEATRVQGQMPHISCSNTTPAVALVGTGIRLAGFLSQQGGTLALIDSAITNAAASTIDHPASLLIERSSWGAQLLVYGGPTPAANNASGTSLVGTNSSTAHGATCQAWGNVAAPAGTLRCGLFIAGDIYGGRVKFSNQGGNPCARIVGPGVRSAIQGFSGGAADGNTDVGIDFSPAGLSGNLIGALGCTTALVGTPSVTGTAGDVRLPGGQIVSWTALLATGLTDSMGNRFVSSTGPLSVVYAGSTESGSAGGATTNYTDNAVSLGGGSAVPLRYPTSQRLAMRLRLGAPSGTGANPPTATLIRYPGGTGAAVVTAMTCTLGAGAAAGANVVDAAHPVMFNDGDAFDIKVTQPIAAEGSAGFVVVLEGA